MKMNTLMGMAFLISQESKCCSWKVGCVIEKDGRIISTGYNGTPAGAINCCDHAEEQGWLVKPKSTGRREDGLIPNKKYLAKVHREDHSKWSKDNEVHAELNAILYAARNGTSIDGANMYITHSPCPDCAKAIAQSGIKQVIFSNLYDKSGTTWQSVLSNSGVMVYQFQQDKIGTLNWGMIRNFLGE